MVVTACYICKKRYRSRYFIASRAKTVTYCKAAANNPLFSKEMSIDKEMTFCDDNIYAEVKDNERETRWSPNDDDDLKLQLDSDNVYVNGDSGEYYTMVIN